MKIAIYGVSRAGKDYLIEQALTHIPQLYHLRGSEALKRLSNEMLGKPFSDTCEDEKQLLRKAFTQEAARAEKQYGNVVVDGHYSFPAEGGGYGIAFTEADKMLYDAFVYLKPKTERIIENQKGYKDGQPVKQFSETEIENWQEFEIKQMRNMCKELDKELFVIDGDLPVCISFLKLLVANPTLCNPRKAVKDMVAICGGELAHYDTVVLTDCDKTLSVKDTGDAFCGYVGQERSAVKEIFVGDYYSAYQFYKWKKLFAQYSGDGRFDDACAFAADSVGVNNKLIDDISTGNVLTIGITTGLLEIWRRICRSISFPQLLFGNEIKDSDYIVSATTKRMLAEQLRSMGKRVIAVGDGILDIPMLEVADKAFIVAQEKLSSPVVKYFAQNKTSIKQLAYSDFKYENVEVVNSIWD